MDKRTAAAEGRDEPRISRFERKSANTDAPMTATPPRPRLGARRLIRLVLLLVVPLALVAGGVALYLGGGRYVSTDNAYVRADKLNLTTDVSGNVAEIGVREGQTVETGQVLFRLDDAPYRIALAGAEAQLGIVRNDIAMLKGTYRQNLAQVEQAKADIGFYQTAFRRQSDLQRSGYAAQAAVDKARLDLNAQQEKVNVAQRQADATLAQLGGRADQPVEANPRFLQAQAAVDKAKRDLDRTVIAAPMSGTVANVASLQVGQYLTAGQPAFSLVASDKPWIEANLKETELTYLELGNKAAVTIDTYPGREWTATVGAVSPATGAEFSVLPAQNASGNWVKVVQRVTVRLQLEVPPDSPPLRAGMSAHVEVDTHHTRSFAAMVHDLKDVIGL